MMSLRNAPRFTAIPPRENEGKIVFYARSLSLLLYHRSSRNTVLFLGGGEGRPRRVVREDFDSRRRGRKNRPLEEGY